MLKALLSACLLLAPLSSVLTLTCRSMYNRTAMTSSSKAIVSCGSDVTNSCSASVLRTNLDKFPRVEIENACISRNHCFLGDYSFTAGDGRFFEMKMECCNTELCNNATLSLPDRNMLAANGLQCPSCFSKGTEKCKSEKTVNCLENETQCIDFEGAFHTFTGTISFRFFTLRGCATTDICAMQKNGGLYFGTTRWIGTKRFTLIVIRERCFNASRISH